MKKPVCSHVSRGCTDNVKADELLLHEQTCGYAPVVCSNEGCKQTVDRRDKETHGRCNGLLYKDRILSFRKGVVETLLKSPGESKTLLDEKQSRNCLAGVHCFDNNIYIVDGQQSTLEKYDVVKNEIKTLSPLPYTVSYMATVAYKDNIIILGGQAGLCNPSSDVWIYNIHSLDYKRLPSMLEARSQCAAVIMGDCGYGR